MCTAFAACCTYNRYVVAGPSLQLNHVAHGKLLSLIAVQKLRCAAAQQSLQSWSHLLCSKTRSCAYCSGEAWLGCLCPAPACTSPQVSSHACSCSRILALTLHHPGLQHVAWPNTTWPLLVFWRLWQLL